MLVSSGEHTDDQLAMEYNKSRFTFPYPDFPNEVTGKFPIPKMIPKLLINKEGRVISVLPAMKIYLQIR